MRWLWGALALAACGPAPSDTGGEPTVPTATTPVPTTPEPTTRPPEVTTTYAGSYATPHLSVTPPPGLVDADVVVDLTSDVPGVPIWYTLDDTPPVLGLSPTWAGPLTVDRSVVIRALVATSAGFDTLTATYLRMDDDLAGFSSNLPLVVLWSRNYAPTFKSDVYTPFTVSTFEPPVAGRVTVPAAATLTSRAGLHVRGSSSAYYPKHPYRLETWGTTDDLDRDVPLLGMPDEADWVLGAPLDFDRAFVRDALMFALSNSIGRYASRTRFAEVFVADRGERVGLDDYVGIYVVTERVERGADRVPITPLLPTDIADPEVTGGYLFKEDRTGPGEVGFRAGEAGGVFSFQQPFVFSDPSEAEIVPEQAQYIAGYLDDLGVALASPGFVNPATGHHYEDLIDVDAWIDHHILNVLSKNPDAFRLSGYFHKDREGLVAAGPIWDFDRTMGCASDSRADDPQWWDARNITSDCTYVFEEGFWRGLFADPAFRDRYWARWAYLLDNELSVPAMDATIDGMAAELSEAAVRDYAAWPAYPPRGGSFEAEIQLLKDWLAARHDWVQGCLALPDPQACTGG